MVPRQNWISSSVATDTSRRRLCVAQRGVAQGHGKEVVDVGLFDVWFPKGDGIELLKEVRSRYPRILPIMMSGHGTIELALTAIRLGAYDFLEKPLELEKVLEVIENALLTITMSRKHNFVKFLLSILNKFNFSNLPITLNKIIDRLTPSLLDIRDGVESLKKKLILTSEEMMKLQGEWDYVAIH